MTNKEEVVNQNDIDVISNHDPSLPYFPSYVHGLRPIDSNFLYCS